MVQLREAVEKSVAEFDPLADNQDENVEFTQTDTVPFSAMAFRYADGTDKLFIFIGLFAAFLFGASLPGFCFVFGALIDDMGGSAGLTSMNDTVL